MKSKKEEKVVDAVIDCEKPFFLPRAVAYIIDSILVFLLCLGITFVLPKDSNHEKYTEEYKQIQTDYTEKKISKDEYIAKSKDVVYDIDYTNTAASLTNIVVLVLYYVVFQFYNKGMTLGKKIMKLKIISTNGKDLSINQVALRAILVDSILVNLLLVGSVLFMNKNYYYYASLSLQGLESVIVIATLIMILFRKDGKGLHDLLAKTKVVSGE